MHRLSFGTSLGAWLVGACLVAALQGCGTSEYNKLMSRRLEALRGEAKFRGLWGPTQLDGTPISIRVPLLFTASYQEDSAHPDDGAKINPDRLQPPFLSLPGFKICYESTLADPQNVKLPFYCHLAVTPAKAGDAENLETEFQTQLKEKFQDTPDAWEIVDCDSPSGIPVHWKKIRVVGEQPFLVKNDPGVAEQNLPGIFEIWMHDAKEYLVMVAWRTPSSIEGPAPPPPPATSVILGLRAPAEKPDFASLPLLTAGSITTSSATPAKEPANN